MYPVIMGKSADPHTVYAFFFKFANIAHMKKICMANFSMKYIVFREKITLKLKSKRKRYNRN